MPLLEKSHNHNRQRIQKYGGVTSCFVAELLQESSLRSVLLFLPQQLFSVLPLPSAGGLFGFGAPARLGLLVHLLQIRLLISGEGFFPLRQDLFLCSSVREGGITSMYNVYRRCDLA